MQNGQNLIKPLISVCKASCAFCMVMKWDPLGSIVEIAWDHMNHVFTIISAASREKVPYVLSPRAHPSFGMTPTF